MYCYYLFSWSEQCLHSVSIIWSLWLFTLLSRESFCLPSSTCFFPCEWPFRICECRGLPCFLFCFLQAQKSKLRQVKGKTLCSWLAERHVLKVFFFLIFKNITRLKEYYSFWVINFLLITEYMPSEYHKIPFKPNQHHYLIFKKPWLLEGFICSDSEGLRNCCLEWDIFERGVCLL